MSSEAKAKTKVQLSQEVFIDNLETFLKLNSQENQQLITNLQEFKQGFCFELSLSRGLLRQAQNLGWWNETYKAILAWDRDPEGLTDSLKKSFMQFAHEVLDYPPKSGAIYNVLAPGSKRRVTGENLPVALEVDRLHLMGGKFPPSSFEAEHRLLQDAFQDIKEKSKEGICLLRGTRHVCELHYANATWTLFDSEYDPKEPSSEAVGVRVFGDHELKALLKAIMDTIGTDIGIYLIELQDPEAKKQHKSLPFESYYEYLQNPKAKNFFCDSRMAEEMLHFAPQIFLDRYTSTTVPKIFKISIARSDEDPWKIALSKGPKAVDALIELGGNVNAPFTFNQKNTLLIDAVINNNDDMIDFLLEKKPQLNYQNAAGDTALICAAKAGKLEIVKKLIVAGADARIKNCYIQNALMCAVASGHLNVVEYLVQNKLGKLYEKNHRGETALMLAIDNNHPEVTEFLLKHSEQISQQGYKKFIDEWIASQDEDEETAFALAKKSDNEQMIKVLLPYLPPVQRLAYEKEQLSKISLPASGVHTTTEVSLGAEPDILTSHSSGSGATSTTQAISTVSSTDDDGDDLVVTAKRHQFKMELMRKFGSSAIHTKTTDSKTKTSNQSLVLVENHQSSTPTHDSP